MASIACPLDQAEWKDRSRHCVSNEQSYHCLRDEYGNLVDACVDPVWIQPGKLYRIEHTFNAGIICVNSFWHTRRDQLMIEAKHRR